MNKEPNRNVYVGHRYVPLILEEWDKKISYEGLSVVTHKGSSYTSKKRVPVGIDILNKEFWSLTGNYNAQVEYYREETERVSDKLDSKSDITYVDTELDKKSDITYVDTEMDKKSDVTYVDNELGKKSDKNYVDTELDKKSDVTYVDNELDKKVEKNELFVSLKDFGAVSDGITDDTQSFKDAISFIENKNGGVLRIPTGTTLLKPDSVPLKLCSNLIIEGEGASSIIKVHPDTGDYWGLFGQLTIHDEKLENVTFDSFKVDQNPSGNSNTNMDSKNDDPNWRQFVVSMWNFDNINVKNMIFSPTTSVNTITCNRSAGTTGHRVKIENNIFKFARGNGNPDYDNSAIYANTDGAIITNNKFYSEQGLNARGCIETHGGNSIISGNYSDGYYTGVNLVGRKQNVPTNINITGNNFNNACRALQLWIHDGIMENVNISDNVLNISPELYDQSYYGGILGAGSVDEENRIRHLLITGNTINYTPNTSSNSYGISLRLRHEIDDLMISNNTIRGANNLGIGVGSTGGGHLNGFKLSDNFLIDCSIYGGNNGYINISGDVENGLIKDNYLLNKDPESKAIRGIVMNSGNFKDVDVYDNKIKSINGSLYNNLASSIDTNRELIIEYPEDGEIIYAESNQLVIHNEGSLPVLKRVRNSGSIGELNHVLRLTYDSVNNCYIANDTRGLNSGVWLDINGEIRVITGVTGINIYTSGSYFEELNDTVVNVRKSDLLPLPTTIADSNGTQYLLSVKTDGGLMATEL